jgi:trehalose/maltose hydrolase-like predicted phosphorylase
VTAPSGGWSVVVDGYDEELQRVHDALLSLGGGGVGTSGGTLLARGSAHRWLVVAGIYDGTGPETHLLVGPVLTGLAVAEADERLRRILDLRHGVLTEQVRDPDGTVELTRFVSLVRPGTVAVRTVPAAARPSPPRLVADLPAEEGERQGVRWTRVAGTHGGIVAAVVERRRDEVVDDVVAVHSDPAGAPDPDEAVARAVALDGIGVDALLAEHRDAWERRWETADVRVEGDEALQRDVRFALFHLIGSVPDHDEAAVGARGTTGTAYRGHVFWDADTFVLPFLAATHPPAARAMLEYRLRRLGPAREAAAAAGRDGARFPWESARTGRDVTPRTARDRTGELVPIRTGDEEEHIVAQVAWAACQYADWTGDHGFERGPGRVLLVETARYWASRVRIDHDGTGHIDGVIGPDEYHESVDDNAFTNVMARWNLRRAAEAVERFGGDDLPLDTRTVEPGEPGRWRAVADSLVDGYDPATGRYEQFAGFSDLEPLCISEVAPRRPIAADLWLGFDRVRNAQVVKQADVVMLHHLVPEAVEPGSLRPNLEHYEPLTAHGSSLSPAIHAACFARLGEPDRALDALHMASRIDLDDLTGTTAGGLHLATMGGLWQALVFGLAGMRARDGRLTIDPHLPTAWDGMEVRVCFHGSTARVVVARERIEVSAASPIPVRVGDADAVAGPTPCRFIRSDDHWEPAP